MIDLLSICDMLPVKATFLSRWTCGSPVAGEKLHFGERGRENRRDGEEKKRNINGRVIYAAGYNHSEEDRLPIIPYMETYMGLQ